MIYVLPGMGADSSMFTGAWRQLPGAVFIDWPPYAGETTLAEIASRVITHYAIPADTDAVVIGTSLGGMVACEIANQLRLRRLILIGSATHPSEINPLLTALQPLARFAPVNALQWSVPAVPGELGAMFSRVQPDFLRASIRAVFQWPGISPSLPPPLRIHGRRDLVIPPPPAPDLLLDGGHLIAMTHARECCDFITASLQLSFASATPSSRS